MFSLVVTVFVAPCIVDILPKLWCCPSHLYSCSLFLNCAFYIYFWGHRQKRYMFQTYKYIVGVCICTSGTARIIEQTDMTNTLILEQAKDWKTNCKMMTKVRNITGNRWQRCPARPCSIPAAKMTPIGFQMIWRWVSKLSLTFRLLHCIILYYVISCYVILYRRWLQTPTQAAMPLLLRRNLWQQPGELLMRLWVVRACEAIGHIPSYSPRVKGQTITQLLNKIDGLQCGAPR